MHDWNISRTVTLRVVVRSCLRLLLIRPIIQLLLLLQGPHDLDRDRKCHNREYGLYTYYERLKHAVNENFVYYSWLQEPPVLVRAQTLTTDHRTEVYLVHLRVMVSYLHHIR